MQQSSRRCKRQDRCEATKRRHFATYSTSWQPPFDANRHSCDLQQISVFLIAMCVKNLNILGIDVQQNRESKCQTLDEMEHQKRAFCCSLHLLDLTYLRFATKSPFGNYDVHQNKRTQLRYATEGGLRTCDVGQNFNILYSDMQQEQ